MSVTKKTILVVDDDPDIVETTRTILETAGYKVETASNGTEALEKVAASAPDLLVLDVMMDKETEGFHVSYELRSNDKTKNIPVIMLTNVGKKSGFKYSAETDGDYLPVDAYMEKPLEPKKLLATVSQLLTGKGGSK